MAAFRLTSSVIKASLDAMIVCDDIGVIKELNQAALSIFEYIRADLIEQNVIKILTSTSNDFFSFFEESIGENFISKENETKGIRSDGSQFPVQVSMAETRTLDGNTNQRMICVFIKNLSAEVRVKDRLGRKSLQLFRRAGNTIIRDVKHEKEMKRSMSLTKAIVQASFDPLFVISEDCKIEMVNEAAIWKFGWSREEFLGNNISMIVGGGHANNHDRYVSKYLKTGKKGLMGTTRESIARRKDGSEFPIEIGLKEVYLEGRGRKFCGFIKDLTRLKQDELALKHKNAITTSIIDASFHSMFAIDEYGTILMVNKASIGKFGWTREEFVGSNIKMIMNGADAQHHDEYLKKYKDTRIRKMIGIQREVTAKRKDGSLFPANLGISEVNLVGCSTMYVAFINDLTNDKKAIQLQIEKASAEALLLNMLPKNIARRLKDDPGHIADHFPSVTILFADIVGFTELSSRLTPIAVVKILNEVFSKFDYLVDQYCLNKVKTIGDCYMVTSIPSAGCPADACFQICFFALDMITALMDFNAAHPSYNLNIRVGINTGPVVAGVVGTKRFLYDLWGDAVNVASRMESSGTPGRIQVTKEVVKLVEKDFDFEPRGLIKVKGKGEMETFFMTHPSHKFPSKQ